MCKQVAECLKKDDDFKQWVLSTVKSDVKNDFTVKALSIFVVVFSKNIDVLIDWILRG